MAERWLRPVVPVKWARYGAAFAGIFVSAMSWTVWNQSTVNEKVYTVSLLSIAIVMWLCVHWGDEPEGPRRDRWLVLIAYVLALSSTNHMMGVLAAPAVAVYVLWTDWRVILKPWLWVAVISAAVVGISINYIYMPIRAAQFPPINEGEPIGFFSQALSDVLNRVQYAKPDIGQRQADIVSQFQNYWQYWSWQFARDWGGWSRIATAHLHHARRVRRHSPTGAPTSATPRWCWCSSSRSCRCSCTTSTSSTAIPCTRTSRSCRVRCVSATTSSWPRSPRGACSSRAASAASCGSSPTA